MSLEKSIWAEESYALESLGNGDVMLKREPTYTELYGVTNLILKIIGATMMYGASYFIGSMMDSIDYLNECSSVIRHTTAYLEFGQHTLSQICGCSGAIYGAVKTKMCLNEKLEINKIVLPPITKLINEN